MTNIQFPNVLFGPGTFTATVLDNNGNPSNVLDAAQEFRIEVEAILDPLSASLLGGDLEFAAYVESIGPGREQQVGPTRTVTLTGATNYPDVIVVPASTLPNNLGPGESGAYKLVTLMTHRQFGAVTDVAAVVEGPILRIS
jgi:hypothetical protein